MNVNNSKIPTDGYLILPISMSRSNNSQSAQIYNEILTQCQQRCADPSTVDVIILYTASLYYNNQHETAWEVKRRTTSQMVSHKAALQQLIQRRDDLQLHVRFMAWDQIVVDAPDYQRFYQKLLRRVSIDQALYDLAIYSIGNREMGEAAISFLVEETVIAHILRQKRVTLPKHNVQNDHFRLLVYPGPYIAIDFYQWKLKILPQDKNITFGCSQYNSTSDELYTFDDMPLPKGNNWQRELRIHPRTKHDSVD